MIFLLEAIYKAMILVSQSIRCKGQKISNTIHLNMLYRVIHKTPSYASPQKRRRDILQAMVILKQDKPDGIYKKYSPAPLRPAGTALICSGTAENIENLGVRSSPTFMMEATLPQR
jgi:hypothetical protein